jgi:hypothetical protein
MVNGFLRLARDDAEPRRNTRERRREIEVLPHVVLGEYARHRLGGPAESTTVAEVAGIVAIAGRASRDGNFVKVICSLRAKRYTRGKEYAFKQSSA